MIIVGRGAICELIYLLLHRLLSNAIHRSILDPAILPIALRNLRGALFPNNAQGTPTLFPPSSDKELRALKRRCASALWAHITVPRAVGRLYFGGSAASSLAAWWRGDDTKRSQNSSTNANTNTNTRNQGASGSSVAFTSSPAAAAAASATSGGGGSDYFSTTTLPSRSGPKDITNDKSNSGSGTNPSAEASSDKDKVHFDDHQHKQHAVDDDLDARIITEIETDILDVFSDAYCNKHLMYGALELILVRLIPELAEKGVMELWEERLS